MADQKRRSLFDVSRPGPGVSKRSSQKRSFVEFWELCGRKFWNLLELGLLYWLLTLPLVSFGFANTGMTFITRNFAREKPVFLTHDFFAAIGRNWKQALPVGIIQLVLTGLMVYSAMFYYWSETQFAILLMAMVLALLVLFSVMHFYLYVMMVTFRYKFRKLYKNALYLTFLGWKSNLVIIGTLLLVYTIALSLTLTLVYSNLVPVAMVVGFFFALFLPPFRHLLTQFYVFPVIKQYLIDPYYKEHPEEFEAARSILNLENKDTRKADEEAAVFKDRGNEKEAAKAEGEKKGKSFPKQYSEDQLRGRGRDRGDADTI